MEGAFASCFSCLLRELRLSCISGSLEVPLSVEMYTQVFTFLSRFFFFFFAFLFPSALHFINLHPSHNLHLHLKNRQSQTHATTTLLEIAGDKLGTKTKILSVVD